MLWFVFDGIDVVGLHVVVHLAFLAIVFFALQNCAVLLGVGPAYIKPLVRPDVMVEVEVSGL